MKVQNVGKRSFMVPGALLPGHTIEMPEHQALRLCSRYPTELKLVLEEIVQSDPAPEAAPKRRRKG